MTGVRLELLSRGATLAGYVGLSLAFFGRVGGWQDHYLGHGGDPVQTVWFMNWWVFSALRHLDPFTSDYACPHGFNLAWTTSVPSLALMSLPLRLLAGPLVAFNTVFVLAPALSAWTAFLLLRDLVASRKAAFVGGYLFGLSSYQVGQQMGHLNLGMTFLVPLARRSASGPRPPATADRPAEPRAEWRQGAGEGGRRRRQADAGVGDHRELCSLGQCHGSCRFWAPPAGRRAGS